MAIQMRRGPLAKYDKNKMLAGEWGIAIDSDTERQKAFIAFAPGVDKEVMFVEDAAAQIANAIDTATEEAEAWAHGNSFHVNDYASGNGSTRSFTLAQTPSSILGVYVDGAAVTAYTRSGKTITFTTAPAAGKNNIRVYYTVSTSTDNAKYYAEQMGTISDDISELKEDLQEAIDEFAVPTQEAVDNWLNAHPEATTTVQDGSLTNAKYANDSITIDKLSQSALYELKNQNISVQYVATKILPYYQSAYDVNEPNECEGIVCVDNYHVLSFYASSDGTDGWPTENSPTKIIEYNLTDNITGVSVIREKTLNGLKHANACGYNPDTQEIYVATTGYTNGSGTNVRTAEIVILDYTTLTVKSTVTVDLSNVSGISAPVLNVIGFDKINKKLYGLTTNQVYEINTVTWKASNVLSCGNDLAYLTQGTQGLAVVGDLVYISFSNPCVLLCYSLHQQKLLRIFNVPKADDDGHVIAQTQDIDYDVETGNFYLNAFQGLGAINNAGAGNQWRANYIFKFNPVTGAIMNSRQPSSSTPTDARTIYVNNSVSTVYQKGSSGYPFKSINEAITALKFSKKEPVIINIADGTYDEYMLIYNVNAIFTGNAITIRGVFTRAAVVSFMLNLTVDGQYFEKESIRIFGSRVGFQYLKSTLDTSETMIRITDSWVGIRDRALFNGTGTGNALYATNSTVIMDVLEISTFKRFLGQSSNFEKSIFPTNSNISGDVWIKCEIAPGLPQTYSITRYEGLLQVAININVPNSSGVKRAMSAIMRKYINDTSITLPVITWFGVVDVILDSTLQLSSIEPLYVIPDFDITGIKYSLQRIYLGL